MLDRDAGSKFDHDPNLGRPLGESTRQFLQKYRATDEFRHGYNLGNMQFADPSHYSEVGKRRTIWVQSFVDRLFDAETVNEADSLLEPWTLWGKIHSDIWRPYWEGEHGDEDVSAHYKGTRELFDAVPIPEEIKQYQGDLTDEDLRSLADGLLWMARDIRGSIDLFEGVATPVSLDTIFKAQRLMNEPVVLAGGLEQDVVSKPSVKRIEHEGKSFIAFDFEGMPADSASEDSSTDAEWERWNKLELGTHVKYLREDRQAKQKTLEAGTVHGFHLLGAGDAMLFGPSVANIGIIIVNDETRFYQCPLVSEIRLDTEEFTPEELTKIEQPKPIDVVVMKLPTGEVAQQTYASMEEATEAVSRQIAQEFGSQE